VKDGNFKISNITQDFSSNYLRCGIDSWGLWSSPVNPPNVTGPVNWSNFIRINKMTGEISVNHNSIPGTKNSIVYEMWVVAETIGKKVGVKMIQLNFTAPAGNKAP